MDLPAFFCLRQRFASHRLEDVRLATDQAMQDSDVANNIDAGQSVAIAVGSRGIENLSQIVKAVVDHVKRTGGLPFIVPAMGSHGGGTAEGQAKVLATFGVSPETMGCPIKSSMETIEIGKTSDGVAVHFDQVASRAHHVIVVNRVKPHTRMVGDIESGLIKMLMIGLGKHRGAALYHQVFAKYEYRLDRIAPEIVPMILSSMPITLGIAIVEDAHDDTSIIEAMSPDRFLTEEPRLLRIARERMPRLPFDDVDLLIVDRIGKEISGTGMDTNVIGRKSNDRAAAPDEFPKVRQIYVRSLTGKTEGNASGIGLAEYCRSQVVEAMDSEMTRINCLTAGHPTAAAIPIQFQTDHAALSAAVTQAGRLSSDELKWLWIPDTLHLEEVACSEAYWNDVKAGETFDVMSNPQPLTFDEQGNLNPSTTDR